MIHVQQSAVADFSAARKNSWNLLQTECSLSFGRVALVLAMLAMLIWIDLGWSD